MPEGPLNLLVLDLLADRQPRTSEEIAAALGVDRRRLRACLRRLRLTYRIVRLGPPQDAAWTLPER